MAKLLIIADDLTGSLDTGIQFALKGISTCVETNMDGNCRIDFDNSDVVVVNTESRHISPREAYLAVRKTAEKGLAAGAEFVYKKTDSALRGNIGAELHGVYDAMGEKVCFVPAFPQMNRITRNGVHYCDGVEIAFSSFGQDPVNPVKHSRVEDVIKETWDAQVCSIPANFSEKALSEKAETLLFDCESDEQLQLIFKAVYGTGARLMAGCAGFAAAVADGIPFDSRPRQQEFQWKGMLVICGSKNPASANQVAYAAANGFAETALQGEEISAGDFRPLQDMLSRGDYGLLHTLQADFSGKAPEEITGMVGEYTGSCLKEMLDSHTERLLMVIGGDTLMGFIRKIGCSRIQPIRSLPGGAVLSVLRYGERWVPVVSKSGGFGDEKLIVTIKELLGC